MNLRETLDTVDFMNLSFGLKHPMGSGKVGQPIHHSDLEGFEVIEYYPFLTPTDTQTLNSCEANSFTLRVEMEKKKLGQLIQMNYDKIYDDACESLHSGWDDGLYLTDSLKTCQEFGVLPADIFAHKTGKSVRAICAALKKYGPLQVGLSVHKGWRERNLSPINAVDELFHPTNRNGHAVLIVGTQFYYDWEVFLLANSWGGRYKLMVMTTRHLLESLLDSPYSYEFPDSFRDFEIPKDYLL